MKHKIIIIILLVSCNLQFTTKCFSQNWEWSAVFQSGISTGNPFCKIDNQKNTYIASLFRYQLSPQGIMSNGDNDIFIAKYDPNGSLVWIKNFGGYNPPPTNPNQILYVEQPMELFVDTISNYIYLAGIFYGTAQFGSYSISTYPTQNTSYFILKLDFNGNVEWVQRTPIAISGFASNNSGNLFFCGNKNNSYQIDSINILSNGRCIVKYNNSGNCIWAKRISDDISPRDIKILSNNIFLNGTTINDTIRIDTIVRYVPNNTFWSFNACFNMEGNVKWFNIYGGYNSSCGLDFSVDKECNIYTTGYFTETGYFGNDTLVANAGQKNMFLAKQDSIGNFQWVKKISAASSIGNSVSNVVDSTFYVTGWFNGIAYFNDSVSAGTEQDMFVAKYNTNGTCLAVNNFGKAEGRYVLQDKENSAYIAGGFYSNITIGNDSYSLYASCDIFLAKLTGTTGIGEKNMLLPMGSLLTIYANPNTGKCDIAIPEEFRNETNLILKIYDLQGKEIQQAKIEMFENKIKLNIEAEAKGVYNVILTNGKKNYSGKIIFE